MLANWMQLTLLPGIKVEEGTKGNKVFFFLQHKEFTVVHGGQVILMDFHMIVVRGGTCQAGKSKTQTDIRLSLKGGCCMQVEDIHKGLKKLHSLG